MDVGKTVSRLVVAASEDDVGKNVGEVGGNRFIVGALAQVRGSGIGRSTGWTVTGHTHTMEWLMGWQLALGR